MGRRGYGNVIRNRRKILIKNLDEGVGQIIEQFSDNNCYAYRIYPEPTGTYYLRKDLITKEQVEQLFDFCQVLEAIIFDVGWEFLINYYGYPVLFEINSISGWFDCSDIEGYKEYIESYRNDIKKVNNGS